MFFHPCFLHLMGTDIIIHHFNKCLLGFYYMPDAILSGEQNILAGYVKSVTACLLEDLLTLTWTQLYSGLILA